MGNKDNELEQLIEEEHAAHTKLKKEQKIPKFVLYAASAFEIIIALLLIIGAVGMITTSIAYSGYYNPASSTMCGMTYLIIGFLLIFFTFNFLKYKSWALTGSVMINSGLILYNIYVVIVLYSELGRATRDYIIDSIQSEILITAVIIILNILAISFLLWSKTLEPIEPEET